MPRLAAVLGSAAAALAVSATAQPGGAVDPDWRAMRLAGEKAVRDRLLLPKAAQFDWQFGFVQSSWKPYNSRVVTGWLTCGAAYTKDKFGYQHGGVFVVVIGRGRPYADVDANPGGPVARGCHGLRLPPPQPGMLDPTPPAPRDGPAVEPTGQHGPGRLSARFPKPPRAADGRVAQR